MYSKITVASETPKTSMKNLWTLLYGHLVVNNTFGFKKLNSPLTFPTCGDYLNIKIYITLYQMETHRATIFKSPYILTNNIYVDYNMLLWIMTSITSQYGTFYYYNIILYYIIKNLIIVI